jgi:membrane protein implicated in regulation of membrane protease activity
MSLIIAVVLAIWVLPSPWGAVAVLAALGLEAVELLYGMRLARQRSMVGTGALIGREARVVRPLDPVGKVALGQERWRASSVTPVPEGALVVVRAVSGLTLVCDPKPAVETGNEVARP